MCRIPLLLALCAGESPASRVGAWSSRLVAAARSVLICWSTCRFPKLRLAVQIWLLVGGLGNHPLPKLPAATLLADLHRLGWRTELVLQMPRERGQPLLVEMPLALRQPLDITPPGESPLMKDVDAALSLQFYFLKARIPLTALQVRHLTSPERLVFGSGPLPTVAKKQPRQQLPTPLDDLVTCLRQLG